VKVWHPVGWVVPRRMPRVHPPIGQFARARRCVNLRWRDKSPNLTALARNEGDYGVITNKNLQQFLFHEFAHPRDVNKLAKYCKNVSLIERNTRYSLPEAIVGSVFSINVRPRAWFNVLGNLEQFANWRELSKSDRRDLSLSDFLGLARSSKQFERKVFCNSHRTSAANGITKAKAAIMVAKIIQDMGVSTSREFTPTIAFKAFGEVRQVPGQKEGVAYIFMLMLLGWQDFVKPDRRIQKGVESVLHRPVRPHYAAEVVRRAAQELGISASNLDLAIWNEN